MGAHWRNLANTTERSVCGGDAALCKISLTTRLQVRWMCNGKVKDRVPSKELRERLGIDNIILIVQQNRLRWYGHVLRKQDIDWVKKCVQYKVEGSKPRDITKRTWREVVQKDCQAHNLNREDVMDRGRWKKLIDWMMVQMVGGCFFWFRLTWVVPDKGP